MTFFRSVWLTKVAPKKGSSSLKQPEGFLTAEKQAEKDALNEEVFGLYKAGQIIPDRDGHLWTIQRVRATVPVSYHITANEDADKGMIGVGAVFRRVSDKQIRDRDFGFQPGGSLKFIDGEFVRVANPYT